MLPRSSRLDWMIAVPLLLFAFYGMNVPLPFANHDWTWLVLVAVSVTWVAAVALVDARAPRRS